MLNHTVDAANFARSDHNGALVYRNNNLIKLKLLYAVQKILNNQINSSNCKIYLNQYIYFKYVRRRWKNLTTPSKRLILPKRKR